LVGPTSDAIKSRAREFGFDACGIAPAADFPELRFFREWLDRGYAGDMEYLRRSADRRADVRAVLPSAKSVIVVAAVYNTDRPYSIECADPDRAHVARYAWGDDYHDVIERRLDALLDWMRSESAEPFEARRYVDTGPVQERVYAQYAGIGWIGKNTCVINPALGSWLFLGEIITSLALAPDPPALDQCGTCALCIEACPTHAIVSPGVLDSTRCISYLTIELRGSIPATLQPAIGTQVYGCDVCQEVCPWNATAPRSSDPAWQPRPAWDMKTVVELSRASDAELATATRRSAMRRTKITGLRRNIDVAIKNTERRGRADSARSDDHQGA
jgi:epoxyqueuosine reductase